jgi:hypothetical protein
MKGKQKGSKGEKSKGEKRDRHLFLMGGKKGKKGQTPISGEKGTDTYF